jgi:hypothetical protein
MNKKLFKSKEEHWLWAWKNYISLYGKINEEGDWEESSIWEEEDLPKLEPFLAWSRLSRSDKGNMPPDVKESFDYYMTVHEAAGEKRDRKEICDEVEQAKLVEVLGFKSLEATEEHEDDVTYIHNPKYSADVELELNEDYEISYPCVMVYYLETGFDRNGKFTLSFVDFVSLSEFDENI